MADANSITSIKSDSPKHPHTRPLQRTWLAMNELHYAAEAIRKLGLLEMAAESHDVDTGYIALALGDHVKHLRETIAKELAPIYRDAGEQPIDC